MTPPSTTFTPSSPSRCLRFDGVIDTGAPWTEFSDEFLARTGLVEVFDDAIPIKPGLETQKYAKILLPSLTICGQTLDDFKMMVSRFDPAWGIAALVGLGFFPALQGHHRLRQGSAGLRAAVGPVG